MTEIGRLRLADGAKIPRLGQGTWAMGEHRDRRRAEIDSLRSGLEHGLTLIDTAEMYADGEAETVVGEAIAGERDRVFLVSKVLPGNATRDGIARSCRASLRRLGVDRLDLYLLHWRGGAHLGAVVDAFERLRREELIARWGVSNFDVDDMAEFSSLARSGACVANQVLYNLEHRGIEHNLLPYAQAHNTAVMAYSPLGQGGPLLQDAALHRVAARHDATPAQIAIAWTLRQPQVVSIPKTASPARVAENAAAAAIVLEPQDLAELDAAFPPPRGKQPLAML